MSVFEDFKATYTQMIDHQAVPDVTIKKYSTVLPLKLINLWKEHGFCGYHKGLFWTINPDTYRTLLSDCIESNFYPIIRTAFGNIIAVSKIEKDEINCEKENFILIDIKNGRIESLHNGLAYFFEEYLLRLRKFMAVTGIKSDLFTWGFMKLGILQSTQCYGFEQNMDHTRENMKTLDIFNYIKASLKAHRNSFEKPEPIDKNLKYSILQALMNKKIFLFDKKDYLQNSFNIMQSDSSVSDYEPFEPIELFFQRQNFSENDLITIDKIVWRTYGKIIEAIWRCWDGEDDYFDIKDISGIEVLPNLTSLEVEFLWQVKELSPLVKLKKLQTINISTGNLEVNSLSPLLEIETLKDVTLEGMTFKDPAETDQVIKELKARGVKVTIT